MFVTRVLILNHEAVTIIRSAFSGDTIRARFARGTVWALFGNAISQGLTVAASVVAARLLGKEAFGELGIIQSTVAMCAVFAGMGLGITATKYVAEYRLTDPARAGRIVALVFAAAVVSGAVFLVVLFVFAPLLAARTLNAPHLDGELRVASVLLFLSNVNGVQNGALAGFEAFKAIARANLARGLVTFPLTIGMVWLWGLPGAVWALVLSVSAGCFFCQLVLQKECAATGVQVSLVDAWQEHRILWYFSLPALLSGGLVGPVTWVANAILVNMPGGYAELGVFHAANQWRMAILFFASAISQSTLPLLASLYARSVKQAARLLYAIVAINIVWAAVPVAAIMIFSGTIMGLYGPGFSGSGRVLALLTLSAGLLAIQSPVANLVAAADRMWAGAALNLAWAIVFLTSVWILTQRGWGAAGLAMAYTISYALHVIWTCRFAMVQLRSAVPQRVPPVTLP